MLDCVEIKFKYSANVITYSKLRLRNMGYIHDGSTHALNFSTMNIFYVFIIPTLIKPGFVISAVKALWSLNILLNFVIIFIFNN